VLSVTGAGRWVLEIKAPKEEITQDTIEQAIAYARHPEVSVTYAAILNGRRFVVMHDSQRSTDKPLIDYRCIYAARTSRAS
jgi:Type I restriction enzyme R protein N terminus (HSDR_N)